jgi:hypothetical protein
MLDKKNNLKLLPQPLISGLRYRVGLRPSGKLHSVEW